MPKHVIEVLNKHSFGINANEVFENLLTEDDAYAIKLAKEKVDNKNQEKFSIFAENFSNQQAINQSKLTEESFTIIKSTAFEDMNNETTASNIVPSQTNYLSELLNEALNTGDSAQVEQILGLMGDGQ